MAVGRDHADRVGLAEYMADFCRSQHRVHGHQHQAGQCRAELDEGPFGRIRTEDRHMLAGPKDAQQRRRCYLGLREKLLLRPSPAGCKVAGAVNEGDNIWRLFCRSS